LLERPRLPDPGKLELVDVLAVHLVEQAVALIRIRARVVEPVVRLALGVQQALERDVGRGRRAQARGEHGQRGDRERARAAANGGNCGMSGNGGARAGSGADAVGFVRHRGVTPCKETRKETRSAISSAVSLSRTDGIGDSLKPWRRTSVFENERRRPSVSMS